MPTCLKPCILALSAAAATATHAQPSPTAFTQDLTRTINTLRQQGCQGKPAAPALATHPNLHDAAARIQARRDIKTALADAGYRSLSTQAIQLGGHRSVASIRGVLAGTYCAAVMPVVAGWLKSPGHCRNILMPELREIGVF